MKIIQVTKKYKRLFNKSVKHPLQSWEWGEFRREWGNKVIRLGIYKKNKLIDAVQVIFSKIPKTNFTIGTIIKGPKPSKELLDYLKKLAEKENAIFIKLEPNLTVLRHPERAERIEGSPPNEILHSVQNDKEILTNLLKNNNCVLGKTLFTPNRSGNTRYPT